MTASADRTADLLRTVLTDLEPVAAGVTTDQLHAPPLAPSSTWSSCGTTCSAG